MMNVQSISCQPLKPNVSMALRPAFKGEYGDCEDCGKLNFKDEFNAAKAEYEELKNENSPLLKTMGTIGTATVAAAAGFYTFKAAAPKGFKFLKGMYDKVSNWKFVKNTVDFVKKHTTKLTDFIKEKWGKINPDSKLGKVKGFLSKKATQIKDAVLGFFQKHNFTKDTAKTAALNTAATVAAVPAAVTVCNEAMEGDKNAN